MLDVRHVLTNQIQILPRLFSKEDETQVLTLIQITSETLLNTTAIIHGLQYQVYLQSSPAKFYALQCCRLCVLSLFVHKHIHC